MIIKLTRGYSTEIDDSCFEIIKPYSWHVVVGKSGKDYVYAVATVRDAITGKRKALVLQRLITNCPAGFVVDHLNGNTLDNRLDNLRICTQAQNLLNRKMQTNNTSGIPGVYFSGGVWRARIRSGKSRIYLGSFDSPELARIARFDALRQLNGGELPPRVSVDI
jgi:hypothetical protein